MRRQHGAGVGGQTEGVLGLGAAAQRRPRHRYRQPYRRRCVAAGPAQRHRRIAKGPDHRVVRTDVDGPVVGEQRVGDRGEASHRVVVEIRERLVADVATGQHQRSGDGLEQQRVHGRVGQHDAQVTTARCDGRRHLGVVTPGE